MLHLFGVHLRYRQGPLTHDDPAGPHRVRQHRIAPWHGAQLGPCLVIQSGQAHSDLRRRHAIGLGEHHVESDDHGAQSPQVRDQPRKIGARPRPLADLGKAPLIDIDDDDRADSRFRGKSQLKLVERLEAQSFQRPRIRGAEDKQTDEADQRRQPATTQRRPRRCAGALHPYRTLSLHHVLTSLPGSRAQGVDLNEPAPGEP